MVQQQLPTGFRDDIGAVAERKDDVSQYVLGLCRNRQYTKISTPLVEYKDVFNGYAMGRGQHMYEFMDSSDASVVIRPDLTMPIGRFLATTNIELPQTINIPIHSYYVDTDPKFITSTANYGIDVPGVVERGRVYGMQFHPEKSGVVGLNLLRAFGNITEAYGAAKKQEGHNVKMLQNGQKKQQAVVQVSYW